MDKQINIKKVVIETTSDCMKLIFSYNKVYPLISFVVTIFLGITPALSMVIMQKILNQIQLGIKSINIILLLVLFYSILEIVRMVATSLYGFYSARIRKNFGKHIEVLILEKAISLNLEDYEDNDTYDTINRAQEQKGASVLSFFDSFLQIGREVITIVSSFFILVKLNSWIILIIIIVPIIQYIYTIKIEREQYEAIVKRTADERKLWYIDYLISMGNSFKEIKIFNLGEYLISKYRKGKNKIIEQDICILKKATTINMVLSFFEYLIAGATLLYIVFQGYLGIILIGDIMVYIRCIDVIKSGVQSLFGVIGNIVQDSLFTELLFRFLNMKTIEQISKTECKNIEKIELINVSYKYKGSNNYSLKNIDLVIEKNDVIVFIGKNGSGKSTLAKIILGLYDNYEGEIFIDDINLKEIDKNDYMEKIGCIFQDYTRYEATLRENVAFGNVRDIEKNEKILKVIYDTKLKKEIYEEMGLETVLGNWFGKQQVSLGEWQRISISRCMFKDANLYVLDEPDSALDVEAEQELLLSYKKMIENKMGIYITHKISHAKLLSEKIILLDKGEIVERGKHSDLILEKGLYFKLYYAHTKLNT